MKKNIIHFSHLTLELRGVTNARLFYTSMRQLSNGAISDQWDDRFCKLLYGNFGAQFFFYSILYSIDSYLAD